MSNLIAVNDVMSVRFSGEFSSKRGLMRVANKAVRRRYGQLGLECPRQPRFSLFTDREFRTINSYVPIEFDGEEVVYRFTPFDTSAPDLTAIGIALELAAHGRGMYRVVRTDVAEDGDSFYRNRHARAKLNWFDGEDPEERANELLASQPEWSHIVGISFVSSLFTWCSAEGKFMPTCDTTTLDGVSYSKEYYGANSFTDTLTGELRVGQHIDYWFLADGSDTLQLRGTTGSENIVLMTTCGACGKHYLTSSFGEGFFTEVNGRTVCKECADNVVFCHRCGTPTFRPRKVGFYEYCPDCARNRRDCIRGYSRTRGVNFHRIGDEDGKLGLYLGIELETEDDNICDCHDWAATAHDVAVLTTGEDDFVDTKYDGSLSLEGVEIVTQPATPRYHLENGFWKSLMEHGGERKVTSGRNCGLHVHVNRSFFGNPAECDECGTTIERLISRFKGEWVKLSCREKFNYCEIVGDEDLGLFPEDCLRRKRKTANDNKHCSHYYAINHANGQTIEFRFFAGTMDLWRIRAAIESVAALAIVAKSVGDDYSHVEDWTWGELKDQLVNALRRNGLSHKEFESLCKEKGL